MKRLFPLFVALLFAGNAMALENEPKEGVSSMAFLGLTTSHIKHTAYGGKAGGTMGFRLDYVMPKAHGTYITAGFDWTMKGGDFDALYSDPTDALNIQPGSEKAKLHYVEIPIRAGFRYNVNKHIGIYGELGPYFAIGVGGKHKCKVDADGNQWDDVEEENTWKAFKKSTTVGRDNFQRWDAGIGFRIGGEYNQHYDLMFGCDWGITDMWRDKYRDAMYTAQMPLQKAKNFQFTLAFGYRF